MSLSCSSSSSSSKEDDDDDSVLGFDFRTSPIKREKEVVLVDDDVDDDDDEDDDDEDDDAAAEPTPWTFQQRLIVNITKSSQLVWAKILVKKRTTAWCPARLVDSVTMLPGDVYAKLDGKGVVCGGTFRKTWVMKIEKGDKKWDFFEAKETREWRCPEHDDMVDACSDAGAVSVAEDMWKAIPVKVAPKQEEDWKDPVPDVVGDDDEEERVPRPSAPNPFTLRVGDVVQRRSHPFGTHSVEIAKMCGEKSFIFSDGMRIDDETQIVVQGWFWLWGDVKHLCTLDQKRKGEDLGESFKRMKEYALRNFSF